MSNTSIETKKSPMPQTALPGRWHSLKDEIDHLFDRFDGGFPFPSMARMFDLTPLRQPTNGSHAFAVDVSEDDKAYKISAELPGLDQKDIDISVLGDRLVLKGEKRAEKEEEGKNYYVAERSYGAFQRSFALPESVDQDKIAAVFAKGVLTITLPKTSDAKAQQKKVAITAA